jgi:hypothetical protein
LLFRRDIVTTFSGEIVTKLRVLSLFALGILVCAVVFAGCSGGGSNSTTITLAPSSGQSLNPGATVTITAVVANDTNAQGVTWTLSGPGSLSGNTKTSVVYTAPATVSTSTTATVTATSVANSTITTTESITLNAVLTITTTSVPSGTLGVPYNAFVNAAGATGTFTWTVTSGNLPPGLTFLTTSTSSSAEITGTPTVLGTSKFTVQVTDTAGTSVTQALSITINVPPPLSVATASLPGGIVDTPYGPQTLQASSGVPPYSWSLTGGALPFGLSLATSGAISGTPVATGNFNFTVKVVDSSSPQQSATANLSIIVSQGVTNNSKLNGNYAFSVSGFNKNLPLLPLFVAAGSFVADGNGHISNGVMDINNTMSDPVNTSFTGTYSIGQNGSGFIVLNTTPSRTFALSMTANGSANIIEFDDSTGAGTRNSGVLLRQDTAAFTGAPASGSYAFGFVGIDSTQNRFGVAGSFTSNGSGTLTAGSLDSDDAGTVSSGVAFSGTSTAVDSNGRGTITLNPPSGPAIYSFYVVNATELLVVGIDTFAPGGNPLVSGTVLQQSNSGFSFSGPSVFEVTALNASTPESQVGIFTASGGGFSLTSDQNIAGVLSMPGGTGNYTIAANGRVTLTGSGFQNSLPVLYMVTTNQAFIIGTDAAVSFGSMTPQAPPQLGFSEASLTGTYAGGSLAPVAPSVWNVVSIAVAGSGNFTVTADVSNENGLSQNQIVGTTSVATNGRVQVTQNGNPEAEILYMVSPAQFVSLSGQGDPTARVDIFQH